ncbi:hypothetical protein MRX96_030700 [Rhipicephalus microplus]
MRAQGQATVYPLPLFMPHSVHRWGDNDNVRQVQVRPTPATHNRCRRRAPAAPSIRWRTGALSEGEEARARRFVKGPPLMEPGHESGAREGLVFKGCQIEHAAYRGMLLACSLLAVRF